MTEKRKFLIFLSQFDFTYSKFKQIVDFMEEPLSIKSFCKTKFDEKILSHEMFERMKSKCEEQRLENYIHNLENEDVFVLTELDEDYPDKLRDLLDKPFFLFGKGDKSLLNKPSLSVVGSRKPTSYGRMVTTKIVREMAEQGVVIISGLAYGVDSIAHRTCLNANGKTIAVLGSGFKEIYPSEHQSLADEIALKGLLLSEYPPEKRATKYTFPQRNRIIAGLSDGVLITEAGYRSGTIHTKDFALDYGKNIYAIPGNIDSELSSLPNDIIKSGQGQCVLSSQDILQDYDLSRKSSPQKAVELSFEEQSIVSFLEDGMKDIEFLSKNCNLSTNLLNSYLTTLEIRGIINRLPGGFVSLC